MKTSALFAASALVALLSFDSAAALAKYLKKIPNASPDFEQGLGHVGTTTTPNDFGKLFSSSGGEWNDALCKAKFPGSDMTVGEAFGDPCCTWKEGGKPDFTVTPFTTTPGKKTECAANKTPASSAPGSPPAAGPSPAPAPAPVPATPSASGNSSATPSPADKPAGNTTLPTDKPADKPTPPAGKPSPGNATDTRPGSKCGVKKETKSLDYDDDSDTDSDDN